MITLENHIKFHLPINQQAAIRAARQGLAEKVGGYTEAPGQGGYVMQSGKLVEENIVLVTGYYGDEDEDAVEQVINDVAAKLEDEEALGYTTRQGFHIIDLA